MRKISILALLVLTCGIFAYGQNANASSSCCSSKENDCTKCVTTSNVHCFTSGTRVMMVDNSMKNIETIEVGDKVFTYDFDSKKLIETEVTKIIVSKSSTLMELIFGGVELTIATDDQPIWTEAKGWASISPKKSNASYVQETPVKLLEIGDKAYIPSKNFNAPFRNVMKIDGEYPTYSLELKKGTNFIANGFIAQIERAK